MAQRNDQRKNKENMTQKKKHGIQEVKAEGTRMNKKKKGCTEVQKITE